jgi:hypothetical protein
VKWLADGAAVAPQTSFNGAGWAVNYATPWNVGGSGVSGHTVANGLVADLAELTMWAGAYVDPTDPSMLPRFYDADNEVPVRMGPTGWRVLQDLGFLSQICLSGPASMFMKNMASGGFDDIGCLYIDTNPTSMFTLAKGALVTALSDPWSDPA